MQLTNELNLVKKCGVEGIKLNKVVGQTLLVVDFLEISSPSFFQVSSLRVCREGRLFPQF